MTRLLISDEVFFSGSLESGSIATRVQPIENIVEDFGQRSLEDKTSFGLAQIRIDSLIELLFG